MRRAGRGRRPILALLVAGLLGVAPPAAAADLTLSVAISLKEGAETLGRTFAARHPGVALRYNFGGSGALEQQIEAGAPVDVFVSAAAGPMDELERRGLILARTRRALARNVLVVVTPAIAGSAAAGIADLLDRRVGRLAIGNPRTVPAGQYARDSLRTEGLWERLGPRLVLAENVRQVLEYVARGEVDAGIVYATDVAAARGRVRAAFPLREATYPPIVYPVAVVAGTREPALAEAFVDHLTGPEGQAVLQRLGFRPPLPGTR